MTPDERNFLAACYSDAAIIDNAVAAGLTLDHFSDYRCSAQWSLLCELRMAGAETDPTAAYSAAVERGTLDKLGGLPFITECSSTDYNTALNGQALLSILLSGYARREAWKLLQRGKEMVEGDSADMAAVGKLAEQLSEVCAGRVTHDVSVADMAKKAEAEARDAIAGKVDSGPLIYTGLDKFDKYATPIRRHEYVVLAARTSHGKSSLMTQIAGHNLGLNKKVVYFQLEGEGEAIVKQMAGQRAMIDTRNVRDALYDRQDKYLKGLQWLGACKNLLVFDRVLALEAIQAKCRMIAQSFQPDVVFIDYGGLITGIDGSGHEKANTVSKAMIPLRKMLGCPLVLAWQFNQGSEKEDREPTRTDFRNSGEVAEDAHRIIAAYRRPGQQIDGTVFDCDILQLKLRDGPLAKVACKFNAPFTKFSES